MLAGFDSDPSEERLRERTDRLRDDRDGIFLAGIDGTVRGYSYFRWGEETKSFVGEDEAGLKEIYVDPDYWGEGIGTALLERGLDGLPDGVERVRSRCSTATRSATASTRLAASTEPAVLSSRSPARRTRR
ncbi:GNAT family N-acetyltransferase [Natronococcus wangiae]|uniref:GNAT family N-acetyltransferase n=1 Tax=Natronococcus wangiae TaxID=3068275 RepID=UPI0031339617